MSHADMKFWELSSLPTARGKADNEVRKPAEVIICPVDSHHRFPIYTAELSVFLTSANITDFVWTWLNDLLIQDRVLRMFREEGFTGFEVKPVKARMKVRAKEPDPCDDAPGVSAKVAARTEIPEFWQVINRGWGGMASPESGIRLVGKCPGCNRQKYTGYSDASRLVDTDQWDGSDFFLIWPLPLDFLVTDRVAHFILKNKLTGAQLVPVDKLQWPKNLPSEMRPGRLRDCFPDDRARELGEPLEIY